MLGLASRLANMNGADIDKKMAASGATIKELGLTAQVIDRIAKKV